MVAIDGKTGPKGAGVGNYGYNAGDALVKVLDKSLEGPISNEDKEVMKKLTVRYSPETKPTVPDYANVFGMTQRLMERLDKDGDGNIQRGEITNLLNRKLSGVEAFGFGIVDVNNDKQISFEEAAATLIHLDQNNKNFDGQIDAKEATGGIGIFSGAKIKKIMESPAFKTQLAEYKEAKSKPSVKAVTVSDEKPVAKPADKPADKATEKNVDKPVAKPKTPATITPMDPKFIQFMKDSAGKSKITLKTFTGYVDEWNRTHAEREGNGCITATGKDLQNFFKQLRKGHNNWGIDLSITSRDLDSLLNKATPEQRKYR